MKCIVIPKNSEVIFIADANTTDFSKLYYLKDPLDDRPLRLGLAQKSAQRWLNTEKQYQLFAGEWQPPEPVRL